MSEFSQPSMTDRIGDALNTIVSPEKRTRIGREAKWVTLILTGIALLGQVTVMTFLADVVGPVSDNVNSPGTASVSDWVKIVKVAWATLPLTFSVALIYVWRNKLAQNPNSLLFVAGLLVGAMILGNAYGLGHDVPMEGVRIDFRGPAAALSTIFSALAAYLTAYGIISFLSALVIGVFLGRAWEILAAP